MLKKVAVVGATGYTGQELVRLLVQHSQVQIHTATSQSFASKQLASVYPNFNNFTELICEEADLDKLAEQVDLIFLALPHGLAAKQVSKELLKKCFVIDLGADFRLKKAETYKQWYGLEHPNPSLLAEAVYGLPELNRAKITGAKLIANPGCYATCSILTLAPLLKNELVDPHSIIIDAKSGVSGAGRSLSLGVHFNECNESIKAYKVAGHRHTPEIEEVLGDHIQGYLQLAFTPHLVPMNRGILITAYASIKGTISRNEVLNTYKSAYEKEEFIRLFDGLNPEYPFPETRWVKGSNFCDIGVTIDERSKKVIAIGALDNLVKGAAGQAIQNMNLLFGLDEQLGLKQVPIFPA